MNKIVKKVLNAGFVSITALSLSLVGGTSTVFAQAAPVCGPMDVVLVIDDTGSMGPAIANVQAGAASIVDDVITASGGDYQMGLVTFKDVVDVDVNLAASNSSTILTAIAALSASGGAGEPEASDEALNDVVNGTGAFTSANFRAGATKIIVLVTDARPAGFDDTYTAGVDDVNAHQRALDAAAFVPAPSILMSALYTETSGTFSATIEPIMMDYASTTGGTYTKLPADGSGTANAILDIIADCGGAPAEITLDPKEAENPVGTDHTVTATVLSGGNPVAALVNFEVTAGPNAGEVSDPGECSTDPNCNTDAAGQTSWTYNGSGGIGTDIIVACFIDEDGTEKCARAEKDWIDSTAPIAQCTETVNPAGKNVPKAPAKGGQGQNQDGFYEVGAKDNVGVVSLAVVDKGVDNVYGTADDTSFLVVNSSKIKYTEANGATPSIKPGTGVIDWMIKGQGDFAVVATDAAGNEGVTECLVPNPPK